MERRVFFILLWPHTAVVCHTCLQGRIGQFGGTYELFEPEQTPFTAVNHCFTLTEARRYRN